LQIARIHAAICSEAKVLYLVEWAGLPIWEQTWEEPETIPQALVEHFHQTVNQMQEVEFVDSDIGPATRPALKLLNRQEKSI